MLNLTGNGTAHTCDGVSRRDFLQVGSLGAVGLSLAEMSALEAAGKVDKRGEDKSVIMIFNLGAPSQIDCFDMKPDAPAEIRGPFKPIATNARGVEISEIFPQHARNADKFSLIRSCYHTGAAVHDTGHQMMQTGRLFSGGVNTPHAGCVLSYLRGRKTDLPAFAVLPETMGNTGGGLPHGQDAGFLGKAHDPFVLNADPSKADFRVPDLLPPQQIGEVRISRRKKLREIVEGTVDQFERSPNAQLVDSNFESAFRLITSPQARAAFDIAKEPKKVREKYGMNRFGQCCLLARRLIEAGVRFVTVNTFLTVFNEITWDIHGTTPFTSIEGMKNIVAPMYDQAYGVLLEDLSERGLLGNTLVCNLAEFGRTPLGENRVGVPVVTGRDHHPFAFTIWMAGAGVKGGVVHGATDDFGWNVVKDPVHINDFHATLLHLFGLDHLKLTHRYQGRDFRLTDVAGKVVKKWLA